MKGERVALFPGTFDPFTNGHLDLTRRAARLFNQLAAPVAAKAVEDTAFFRYGRLLSRNDVGFSPTEFSCTPEEFQARASARV